MCMFKRIQIGFRPLYIKFFLYCHKVKLFIVLKLNLNGNTVAFFPAFSHRMSLHIEKDKQEGRVDVLK